MISGHECALSFFVKRPQIATWLGRVLCHLTSFFRDFGQSTCLSRYLPSGFSKECLGPAGLGILYWTLRSSTRLRSGTCPQPLKYRVKYLTYSLSNISWSSHWTRSVDRWHRMGKMPHWSICAVYAQSNSKYICHYLDTWNATQPSRSFPQVLRTNGGRLCSLFQLRQLSVQCNWRNDLGICW